MKYTIGDTTANSTFYQALDTSTMISYGNQSTIDNFDYYNNRHNEFTDTYGLNANKPTELQEALDAAYNNMRMAEDWRHKHEVCYSNWKESQKHIEELKEANNQLQDALIASIATQCTFLSLVLMNHMQEELPVPQDIEMFKDAVNTFRKDIWDTYIQKLCDYEFVKYLYASPSTGNSAPADKRHKQVMGNINDNLKFLQNLLRGLDQAINNGSITNMMSAINCPDYNPPRMEVPLLQVAGYHRHYGNIRANEDLLARTQPDALCMNMSAHADQVVNTIVNITAQYLNKKLNESILRNGQASGPAEEANNQGPGNISAP